MRVNQGYILVGKILFWQLGAPINTSLVFTLITYSLQNRNTWKKYATAKISEKGFHPSCILDLSCRRWHQVPWESAILSQLLSHGCCYHSPPSRRASAPPRSGIFHASRRWFPVQHPPPRAVVGVEKQSNIATAFALLIVYAKRNDIFLAKYKQPVNCRKSN